MAQDFKQMGIKFHSTPVYNEKYIKAREFNRIIKTSFQDDKIPEEELHPTCIACITVDSVMRVGKLYYLQVYSGECKYNIKKIKISEFIGTKLESDASFHCEYL